MREVEIGGIYRHFKGLWYKVLTIAENTETKNTLVVYQALYEEKKVYCRIVSMFLSEVDRDKYPNVKQKYRFINIKELGEGARKLMLKEIKRYEELPF